MPNDITFALTLPPPPARLFCVGIGGIGVSSLAQYLITRGYDVAGSDRGLTDPSKEHLYRKLRLQGIRLYPQDGSGVTAEHPDALVISNAVEPGNADLLAAGDTPVLHRARALAQALNASGAIQIAVAGSCGKTSVTGWIAAALRALGKSVAMINGGYALDAESERFPGNFYTDPAAEYAVVEVDESDKSIVEFTPHYGVLLNVGSDHYDTAELNRVFGVYLGKCSRGVAVLHSLRQLAPAGLPVATFDAAPAPDALFPVDYTSDANGIDFTVAPFGRLHSSQSGRHSALNACAVLALLKLLPLNLAPATLGAAITPFPGIRQRFEIVGQTADGIPVINDYAHNPEKIAAALATARERFGSPIAAAFQPHGFSALRNFRKELCESIAQSLKAYDLLVMLPVYYAGGTATPTPTSAEVTIDIRNLGIDAHALERPEAAGLFASRKDIKAIVVMGARDPSLRVWSFELAK